MGTEEDPYMAERFTTKKRKRKRKTLISMLKILTYHQTMKR
jgi:hypothetical protein